ncbi:putative lipid II flippase FtsW [Gammaproteobacteria bacterium 53_120_T64]|nr:putative lipid II flippase FtsW [Gammaproteobacteria bacterium 53_120_T64]
MAPFGDFWQPKPLQYIDRYLLLAVLALASVGLLMIMSASISFADQKYGDAFFFTKRHLLYLLIGASAALVVLQIPMLWWYEHAGMIVLAGALALALVLIPGIGHAVNGSRRWFKLGMFTLQVSELAKVCMIFFVAAYLQRHQLRLRDNWHSFAIPLGVLAGFALLLLLEPDFGSTVVLAATVLAMLFLAGVRLWQFLGLMAVGIAGVAALALSSEYRFRRLVTFLDPWAQQFGDGYQLTQSLIAFGRGEWFGVGLGNSVQKLFYLPEAHTDFVFAILAEEFGLLGVLVVMLLFTLMITRIFLIARKAVQRQDWFSAYVVFGIGILLAGQVFINIGVTSGLLPTKGLTLPFISYGGSSLLVCAMMIALVMRVGIEMHDLAALAKRTAKTSNKSKSKVAQ